MSFPFSVLEKTPAWNVSAPMTAKFSPGASVKFTPKHELRGIIGPFETIVSFGPATFSKFNGPMYTISGHGANHYVVHEDELTDN